jgi:hypothetical protein
VAGVGTVSLSSGFFSANTVAAAPPHRPGRHHPLAESFSIRTDVRSDDIDVVNARRIDDAARPGRAPVAADPRVFLGFAPQRAVGAFHRRALRGASRLSRVPERPI